MKSQDYRIAYKFLKIRATESDPCTPFRVTENLPAEQQNRIYSFLQRVHNVKFI